MDAYANYPWRTGELVRAFHPLTLGVVRTGRIVRLGRKWVTVDFGELGGGTLRIARRDLVEPAA